MADGGWWMADGSRLVIQDDFKLDRVGRFHLVNQGNSSLALVGEAGKFGFVAQGLGFAGWFEI